jgi:hypothetical protein
MYTSMFRKAMLGDTATLNLDFTTGVLDSRLTFTRAAGTATYTNSSGYVTTAAANTPRFDYDPVTLAPRGLLIEGSAINVCPRSQELTTGWLNANMITPTNPAIADPFGGTSATWKLLAASGSALHSWRHAVITLTAAAYTFSFWAKAAEYDRVVFSDPGSGLGACTFVLTGNGTATVVGGATNPQITPYPNGWYRCSVTMTTLATTYAFGIAGYPSGATLSNFGATYTGTGTDGVYATGLQIELGSGASSYISTGASQVTRNGDSCVMTGTNFSSWFAGATEGVLFAQYEKPRSQSGNAAHDFSAVGSRYTTGAGFILYAGNSNYYPTNILWPTGGAIFGGGIATAIPSVTKQAGKWFGGNDVTNYSNGVVGTTVAGTGTLIPAMLSFGANSATGTEATRDWLNACIRQVKFYPTALSDAAIQTLTTT